MSTRKLIMWALFCGVLILGAGVFKLWQTTGDGAQVQLLQLGDSAVLGDMTVSVNAVSKNATQTLVEVSMQGVEGADALAVLTEWPEFSGVDANAVADGSESDGLRSSQSSPRTPDGPSETTIFRNPISARA